MAFTLLKQFLTPRKVAFLCQYFKIIYQTHHNMLSVVNNMFSLTKYSAPNPETQHIKSYTLWGCINDPRNSSPFCIEHSFNPLTPNDLQRRRAVSPLKIKIPSKNLGSLLCAERFNSGVTVKG
jgi:hypothetical protein